MDIAWWSLSPGIVWHFEVRDGLLVMKMSSMLFHTRMYAARLLSVYPRSSKDRPRSGLSGTQFM